MLKRIYAIVLAGILSVCLFGGCNIEVASPTVPALFDIIGETEADYTEANSKVAGVWVIGGVSLSNKIYDVSQKEELQNISNGTVLTLNEDGTFTYLNFGTYEGTYSWQDETTILLSPKKLHNINGTVHEDVNTLFIATILDDTTLQWGYYDPIMGTIQHEYNINSYYLERIGVESKYVLENCTPLN